MINRFSLTNLLLNKQFVNPMMDVVIKYKTYKFALLLGEAQLCLPYGLNIQPLIETCGGGSGWQPTLM